MAASTSDLFMQAAALSTPPGAAAGDKDLDISLFYNFKSHLLKTGKVCPRPWCWGRFFMAFQPRYESYWLADWWQTSDIEKRERLLEQLDFLVRQTGQFRAAYRFLCNLEDKDWHFSRDT